ncbi:MAG TPA: hypothetical protein VF802_06550, partial [Candidatus Limnocylindrales bacterium]
MSDTTVPNAPALGAERLSAEAAHTPAPDPIFTEVPARSPHLPGRPADRERAPVEMTIDGRPVAAPAGATILEAC